MSSYSDYASTVADIELSKGRARGDAQRASGELWGQTLTSLGETIPKQVQDAMKAAAERRQQQQMQSIFQKHGGNLPAAIDEVMTIDPVLGMDLGKRYSEAQKAAFDFQTAQWKAKKDEIDFLGNLLGSATDENGYAQALVTAQMAGLQIPPEFAQYDPQRVQQLNRALLTAKERLEMDMPKPPEPFTLSPGSKRFAGDGSVLAEVPYELTPDQAVDNERTAAAAAETARHNRAMEQRDPASEPLVTVQTPDGPRYVPRSQAVGQAPAAPQSSPRELTPNAALSMTRSLRNDYVRETASARTSEQQLAQMKSSLAAVKQGGQAPGSQGVLVTFQKILDPTSVVRESEYARSASGLSLLSRLEGQWMRMSQGGAGVTVNDLQQFVNLAEQFAVNQRRFAAETRTQIDAIASEYGLKPELITREIGPTDDVQTLPNTLDTLSQRPSTLPNTPETQATPPTPLGLSYQDYLRRRGGGQR